MPTLAAICYGNDRLAELVKPQIAPAHVLLVLLPHLKRQQESQHESHQQNGNSDAAHALHCQEMLALATPSAPLPDQYRLQQRLPVELRAQVSEMSHCLVTPSDTGYWRQVTLVAVSMSTGAACLVHRAAQRFTRKHVQPAAASLQSTML
jgi:hypothetical protein